MNHIYLGKQVKTKFPELAFDPRFHKPSKFSLDIDMELSFMFKYEFDFIENLVGYYTIEEIETFSDDPIHKEGEEVYFKINNEVLTVESIQSISGGAGYRYVMSEKVDMTSEEDKERYEADKERFKQEYIAHWEQKQLERWKKSSDKVPVPELQSESNTKKWYQIWK